jgi:hypothetical protein
MYEACKRTQLRNQLVLCRCFYNSTRKLDSGVVLWPRRCTQFSRLHKKLLEHTVISVQSNVVRTGTTAQSRWTLDEYTYHLAWPKTLHTLYQSERANGSYAIATPKLLYAAVDVVKDSGPGARQAAPPPWRCRIATTARLGLTSQNNNLSYLLLRHPELLFSNAKVQLCNHC